MTAKEAYHHKNHCEEETCDYWNIGTARSKTFNDCEESPCANEEEL